MQIENCTSPEQLLDYRNFGTSMDARNGEEDYQRGLKAGNAASVLSISVTGSWHARNKDESSVTSYEKIGYHANTSHFWRGVLDSGCKIVWHHLVDKRIVTVAVRS